MNTPPAAPPHAAPSPAAFTPDEHLELQDAASPVEPYPHQLTTWDKMTRLYGDERKLAGLVVLPTGGGKTVVAASWLLRNVIAKGGRVIWLAHRQSLLRQAFGTFKRLANQAYPARKTIDLIAISSEFHNWSAVSPEHDVIFASVQSSVLASNRGFVKELLESAGERAFVVIDEAHHAVAPRTLELLSEIKASGVRLLGLTATPIRMDQADQKRLGALFDRTIIHQVSRRELSDAGILAAPSTETDPLLSSPDVPRFVVEFVLFHELLHGDMPSAGHNADFRARERQFLASPPAIEEAKALGITPGAGSPPDFWRVRAEMFLDTFERYFQWKQPGTWMVM